MRRGIYSVFAIIYLLFAPTGCSRATDGVLRTADNERRPTCIDAITTPEKLSNTLEFANVRRMPIQNLDDPCIHSLVQRILTERGNSTDIAELALFEADNGTIRERYNRLIRFVRSRSIDADAPPDFEKWLDGIQLDQISVFEIRADGRSALAFRSLLSGATGMSVRYLQWMVVSEKSVVGFESLSDNPRMIFWDKEGRINYNAIVESEPKANAGGPWDAVWYRLSPSGKVEVVQADRRVDCKAPDKRK